MLRAIYIGFLLILVSCPAHPRAFEQSFLELYVSRATGRRISKFGVTCQYKRCSSEISDSQGKVRLKLTPELKPGDWVVLSIVRRKGAPPWVLISPWDEQVAVPSFSNKPEKITTIFVVLKGDKQILSNGLALTSLTQRCVGRVQPKGGGQITDEERLRIRKELAASVGFTPEELDRAIREWGTKAKDPYDRALVEHYKENYKEAEKLIEESLQIRKGDYQQARAKYADALFLAGKNFYAEGKYSLAFERFQELNGLQKDNPEVLNWLGESLHAAGRYVDAEAPLKQALEIRESTLGVENADTARSFNNLADLYRAEGRYADAEQLHKRALDIFEKVLGTDDIETAGTMNNLGVLYSEQGRYADAEPLDSRP